MTGILTQYEPLIQKTARETARSHGLDLDDALSWVYEVFSETLDRFDRRAGFGTYFVSRLRKVQKLANREHRFILRTVQGSLPVTSEDGPVELIDVFPAEDPAFSVVELRESARQSLSAPALELFTRLLDGEFSPWVVDVGRPMSEKESARRSMLCDGWTEKAFRTAWKEIENFYTDYRK